MEESVPFGRSNTDGDSVFQEGEKFRGQSIYGGRETSSRWWMRAYGTTRTWRLARRRAHPRSGSRGPVECSWRLSQFGPESESLEHQPLVPTFALTPTFAECTCSSQWFPSETGARARPRSASSFDSVWAPSWTREMKTPPRSASPRGLLLQQENGYVHDLSLHEALGDILRHLHLFLLP